MDALASLLTQAFEVFQQFKSAGLLLGLMALVNLLVNVTKLPWLDKFFADKKWVRGLVALGLGLVGGLVQSLASGHSAGEIAMAGLTGLVAGLGAMGLHETVQAAKALQSK